MSDSNLPEMTLRFHPIAGAIAASLTVIGAVAACRWGGAFLRGDDVGYPVKLKFFLCLLAVIGPGFLIMVQQRIVLFRDRVESRLLGIRRTLDRATLKVLRSTSNGYLICDASGRKIHVHRLMGGAGNLRALIDRQNGWGPLR